MSIWGKLAAATADLTIASPIAALLGGGAASDVSNSHGQDGPGNGLPFTVGVIVLSAKMAKADGSVTADEVAAFREAFNVSAAEMKQAAGIYNLAKLDMTGYEPCAAQLVAVLRATASCSRMCLKVSSISPRPMTRFTRRKKSSLDRSPSSSVLPTRSSATSRRATRLALIAIPTTYSASNRQSAITN
jgi:hypothetical protein